MHSNEVDYLKTFKTNLIFFDPNFIEIYNKITSVLLLILLILSSQKLADLPYLWLFLQSNLFSFLKEICITLGGNVSFFWKNNKIVYAILAITINKLEMHFGNLNLPLGKSTIWFKSSIQKGETSKQITGTLFYQY